jgi:hypothetical protein
MRPRELVYLPSTPSMIASSFRRGELRGLLLSAIAMATPACSVLMDPERVQCEQPADCGDLGFDGAECVEGTCRVLAGAGGGGGSVDPRWACVGATQWPGSDPSMPTTHRTTFRRLFGESPIADMDVTACTQLDAGCQQPVDAGTTDAMGTVELALFYGFSGYLRPQAPASFPEMTPSLVVTSPPVGVGNFSAPVHLTSVSELDLAAQLLEVTPNPELGHLFGLAVDCDSADAGGVSVEVDKVSPETVKFYLQNGLPTKTATETYPSGDFGFANLPPGFVTVTATSRDAGKMGVLTVLIQPGSITYVPLGPTPL